MLLLRRSTRGASGNAVAEPAVAGNEQHLKQRAMRRLALAAVLIVGAIVGLGLLDHYTGRKRPAVAEAPPTEPPVITTLPAPKPLEPGTTAPAPAPPPATALPPPPPPSVGEQPTAPSAAQPSTSSQPPAAHPAGQAAVRNGPAEPKPRSLAGAPAAVPALEARQGFVVQLGVFMTVENAQSLQARLKGQGIPAFLETRVVVGPFRDRAEADAVQHKLKDLGVAGVIVQRK